MKITVITVCYNVVDEIEETIQSVINQTYDDIEYIIIDGGSSDGTIDIIKRYSLGGTEYGNHRHRITKWISETDSGIYDAMNKGIDLSSGEYVNFMNAGDTFFNADTILEIMNKCNQESIVYGNIYRIFDKNKIKATGIVAKEPDLVDFARNTIHHQSAFIKKSLFKKYGYYDLRYKLASDWIFFVNAIAIGKEPIKYNNVVVANFKMNGASTKFTDLYDDECKSYYNSIVRGIDYEELYNLRLFRESRYCRLVYKLVKYTRALKQTIINSTNRK